MHSNKYLFLKLAAKSLADDRGVSDFIKNMIVMNRTQRERGAATALGKMYAPDSEEANTSYVVKPFRTLLRDSLAGAAVGALGAEAISRATDNSRWYGVAPSAIGAFSGLGLGALASSIASHLKTNKLLRKVREEIAAGKTPNVENVAKLPSFIDYLNVYGLPHNIANNDVLDSYLRKGESFLEDNNLSKSTKSDIAQSFTTRMPYVGTAIDPIFNVARAYNKHKEDAILAELLSKK